MKFLGVITQNEMVLGIIVFISMVLGFVKAWGVRSGKSSERSKQAERTEEFEGVLADAQEAIELGKSDVDRANDLKARILGRRVE